MDYEQSTDTKINSLQFLHPAYLFMGQEDILLDQVTTLLQKQLCKRQEGCATCSSCHKVRLQQHESIIWFYPEKQYALDDLKVIFSTIIFALEPDQHFFFVIQKADLLTTACANALLKSLEEPPAGYHFILLAQRTEFILPTIQSRCIVEYFRTESDTSLSAFLSFFTSVAFHDPLAFAKELEVVNPSERETLALLDQLLSHWASIYKKSLITQQKNDLKQAERMITHLKKAMLQPPMPGGNKLFWKNLFLQIKEI